MTEGMTSSELLWIVWYSWDSLRKRHFGYTESCCWLGGCFVRRFRRLDTPVFFEGMTAWDLSLCRWFFLAVLTLTRYQQGGYRDQYITPAWPLWDLQRMWFFGVAGPRDLWMAGHRRDPGCASSFPFMSLSSNAVFVFLKSAYWSRVAVLTILLVQLHHTHVSMDVQKIESAERSQYFRGSKALFSQSVFEFDL